MSYLKECLSCLGTLKTEDVLQEELATIDADIEQLSQAIIAKAFACAQRLERDNPGSAADIYISLIPLNQPDALNKAYKCAQRLAERDGLYSAASRYIEIAELKIPNAEYAMGKAFECIQKLTIAEPYDAGLFIKLAKLGHADSIHKAAECAQRLLDEHKPDIASGFYIELAQLNHPDAMRYAWEGAERIGEAYSERIAQIYIELAKWGYPGAIKKASDCAQELEDEERFWDAASIYVELAKLKERGAKEKAYACAKRLDSAWASQVYLRLAQLNQKKAVNKAIDCAKRLESRKTEPAAEVYFELAQLKEPSATIGAWEGAQRLEVKYPYRAAKIYVELAKQGYPDAINRATACARRVEADSAYVASGIYIGLAKLKQVWAIGKANDCAKKEKDQQFVTFIYTGLSEVNHPDAIGNTFEGAQNLEEAKPDFAAKVYAALLRTLEPAKRQEYLQERRSELEKELTLLRAQAVRLQPRTKEELVRDLHRLEGGQVWLSIKAQLSYVTYLQLQNGGFVSIKYGSERGEITTVDLEGLVTEERIFCSAGLGFLNAVRDIGVSAEGLLVIVLSDEAWKQTKEWGTYLLQGKNELYGVSWEIISESQAIERYEELKGLLRFEIINSIFASSRLGASLNPDDYLYPPSPTEEIDSSNVREPALFKGALKRLSKDYPSLMDAFKDPRFAGFFWAGYMISAAAIMQVGEEYIFLLNENLKERLKILTPESITLFLYLLTVHEATELTLQFKGAASGINTEIAAESLAIYAYSRLQDKDRYAIKALCQGLPHSEDYISVLQLYDEIIKQGLSRKEFIEKLAYFISQYPEYKNKDCKLETVGSYFATQKIPPIVLRLVPRNEEEIVNEVSRLAKSSAWLKLKKEERPFWLSIMLMETQAFLEGVKDIVVSADGRRLIAVFSSEEAIKRNSEVDRVVAIGAQRNLIKTIRTDFQKLNVKYGLNWEIVLDPEALVRYEEFKDLLKFDVKISVEGLIQEAIWSLGKIEGTCSSRLGLKLEPEVLAASYEPQLVDEVAKEVYEPALARLKQSDPVSYNLIKAKVSGFFWATDISMPSAAAIIPNILEEGKFLFCIDEPLKELFTKLTPIQIELILYLLLKHEARHLLEDATQTTYRNINSELAAFLKGEVEGYYSLSVEEKSLFKQALTTLDSFEQRQRPRFLPIITLLEQYTQETILVPENRQALLDFLAQDTRLRREEYEEQAAEEYIGKARPAITCITLAESQQALEAIQCYIAGFDAWISKKAQERGGPYTPSWSDARDFAEQEGIEEVGIFVSEQLQKLRSMGRVSFNIEEIKPGTICFTKEKENGLVFALYAYQAFYGTFKYIGWCWDSEQRLLWGDGPLGGIDSMGPLGGIDSILTIEDVNKIIEALKPVIKLPPSTMPVEAREKFYSLVSLREDEIASRAEGISGEELRLYLDTLLKLYQKAFQHWEEFTLDWSDYSRISNYALTEPAEFMGELAYSAAFLSIADEWLEKAYKIAVSSSFRVEESRRNAVVYQIIRERARHPALITKALEIINSPKTYGITSFDRATDDIWRRRAEYILHIALQFAKDATKVQEVEALLEAYIQCTTRIKEEECLYPDQEIDKNVAQINDIMFDKILAFARRIPNAEERINSIYIMACELMRRGKIEECLQAIEAEDSFGSYWSFLDIFPTLVKEQRYAERARKLSRKISELGRRIDALLLISEELAKNGEKQKAEEALREAYDLATRREDKAYYYVAIARMMRQYRLQIHTGVLSSLPREKLLEEALERAKVALEKASYLGISRTPVLDLIAEVALAGEYDKALSYIPILIANREKISAFNDCISDAYGCAVKAAAENGDYDKALKIAENIGSYNASYKEGYLNCVVLSMVKRGGLDTSLD
ncbi:MAG: hypothetical protein HY350_04620, partial [Candidatus Omnitrophica bacterium]|nr:hypothetical protein [Candidatus Omnitrophota bacterium]